MNGTNDNDNGDGNGSAAGEANSAALSSLQLPSSLTSLLPDERVLYRHQIMHRERVGYGWLTSERVIVRVDQPSPALAAKMMQMTAASGSAPSEEMQRPIQSILSLSSITDHKVSVVKKADSPVMLRIMFHDENGQAQHVDLRFISERAVDERTLWKEWLMEQKKRMTQLQAPSQAATLAMSEMRVKMEPDVVAPPPPPPPRVPPTVALVPSPSPSPSSSPSPTPSPPARPSGVKRSHGDASATPARSPPVTNVLSTLPPGLQDSLLKSRAALLVRDPALKQLYEDLVQPGRIISEDEFWSSRAELLREEQKRQGLPVIGAGTGGAAAASASAVQKAGLSSSMASSIKPVTGCNRIQYTLDAQQIHAIFLENPMVHDLYMQLVPDRLSEAEFWTKYFRTQYVHAQANASVAAQLKAAANEEDELFRKAAMAQEEKERQEMMEMAGGVGDSMSALDTGDAAIRSNSLLYTDGAPRTALEEKRDVETKAMLAQRHVDPSVDLTSADMSNAVLAADPTRPNTASTSIESLSRSRKARAQSELLRKFNRHGMLVLDSSSNNGKSPAPTTTRNASTTRQGADATAAADSVRQSEYHSTLAAELELRDLEADATPQYHELTISNSGKGLFQSATTRQPILIAADEPSLEERRAASASFMAELSAMTAQAAAPQPVHLPSNEDSVRCLLQLTRMATGMNKAAIAAKQLRDESSNSDDGSSAPLVVFSTSGAADMPVPEQFASELKKRYHCCTELFRHFWASLNPRSVSKLKRIYAALEEQQRLLTLIRQTLNDKGYSALVPMLNPLLKSIEQCIETYAKWEESQAKRMAATMRRPIATNPHAARNAMSNTTVEPEAKRIKV